MSHLAALGRLLVPLLVAGASISSLAAPAPTSIRVVLDDNYPPYVFRDSEGRVQGILKDLWDLWQKRTGISVDFQPMDWGKARAVMESGHADVIDTIFATEERRRIYDFSRPYATIEVPIFFDRNISGITDAASLKGFTVGVKDGDACVNYLKAHGIAELKHYPSYEAEVKAAIRQEVRVLCIDKPPAFYFFNREGAADEFRYSPPLYVGEFHWAVRKGRNELKALVEDGFSRISADEREAIETRWMGKTLGANRWPEAARYGAYVLFAAMLLSSALFAWNRTLRRRVGARTRELSAIMHSLRQSEERRRAILNTAMDGFWLADAQGRLLEVNETYCRMSAYSMQELLRMRIQDLEVVEAANDTLAHLHKVKAQGEDRFESRHRRKDGSVFDVEVSVQYRPGDGECFVVFLRDITERKQLALEKHAREQQLRTFYELDLVGLAITTPEKGWVRVNQCLCRMLEYSEQELRAMSWAQLTHPDDLAADVEQFTRLLANEIDGYSLEKRFVSRSGKIVYTKLVVRCIRKANGEVDYVTAMVEDITEHKRAENALMISEDRFRKAFYLSPDAVNINRLEDGLYVSVNRGFTQLMGYTEGEIIGHTSIEFDIWDQPEDRRRMVEGLRKDGVVANLEARFRAKDGSTRVGLMSAAMIEVEGVPHVISITRDISGRKHAETEMRKLSHAIEQSPSAIVITDPAGDIEYVNPRFEQVTGYAAAEALGRNPRILKSDTTPAETYREMWQAISAGGEWRGELCNRRKNGELFWEFAAISGVKGESGEIEHYIAVKEDITERKKAEAVRDSLEAQLRESQKMQAIGTLAGGIAHDFNNIIATILGNTELARQDVPANSLALESLEEIRKAGSRARDLVQQILSFSRRQPAERKLIALAPIVEESARLLRATLPARLSLEVHCAADVPPVLADATQIQQILLNLATNSMQVMGSGSGRIGIRLDSVMLDAALAGTHPELGALHARHPGRTARLAVSDDGPGIDAAILGRIFEPFFTTKPVGEGTGLGLSVAHGIAQVHEGAIVVDSQAGKGATFTLYLPAAETQSLAPTAKEGDSSAAATDAMGSGQHILYIDDDESLVLLVRRLLGRRGYRVSAYTDQRAALDALRADPAGFDLVLADYNMPGMSGLDVAREVRAIRADLPVAVASGFIDEKLRAEAPAAGVRELVFKADAVEDLCEAFARLAQSIGGKSKPS